MAHSRIQGCVVILALAMFQPAYLKSLQSKTREERVEPDRIERTADPDRLTFPDASLKVGFPVPDIAPCPDGQEYCDSADDYPTNQIKESIKKQPKFILDHFYVESVVIFPNKAKSKEGFYEFVVNDDENKQGVRVERCISGSNNNQCSIPGSLSLGYTSFCEQKHIQRALVVVDKNSPGLSGFITKPFNFPSCCSCKIIMTGEIDRFGFTPANTTSAVANQTLTQS